MPGVSANDVDHAFSSDNLALVTYLLYRCPHLNGYLLGRLFVSVDYPSTAEIIRGQLNCHFVSGQNLDEVHPHLPRNMSQDAMAIFQFHPERGVWQGVYDSPFHFDKKIYKDIWSILMNKIDDFIKLIEKEKIKIALENVFPYHENELLLNLRRC